jgi:hypothetical protein
MGAILSIRVCSIWIAMQVFLKCMACANNVDATQGLRILVTFPFTVAMIISKVLNYNPVLHARMGVVREDRKKIYICVFMMGSSRKKYCLAFVI